MLKQVVHIVATRLYMHRSRPALGPTQPPIQWVPVNPQGNAAGAWRWPQTHLELRLKKKYIYTSTPPLGLRGLL